MIRLHLSESFCGPSPAAVAAYSSRQARLSVYPDPARADLLETLARFWRLDPSALAVANGSDELVLLSALGVGRRELPGLYTEATFPGYRNCLEGTGRGGRGVSPFDLDAFISLLPEHGVGYVCNPHNPSGRALSAAELDRLVEAAGRTGVPIVFDEAYLEFAPPGTPNVRERLSSGAPLVALRTFSKAWGLAALRIGYAFGAAGPIAAIRAGQQMVPFSANAPAQAAAVACLGDTAFIGSVNRRNLARRTWFTSMLARQGFDFLPSVTNFVAVRVPDSAAAERWLAERHGILVRDAGLFGLDGYLRISMGTEEQMLALVSALVELRETAPLVSSPG